MALGLAPSALLAPNLEDIIGGLTGSRTTKLSYLSGLISYKAL